MSYIIVNYNILKLQYFKIVLPKRLLVNPIVTKGLKFVIASLVTPFNNFIIKSD
jgi:hypothetical protein